MSPIYDPANFDPYRSVARLMTRVKTEMMNALDRDLAPFGVSAAQYVVLVRLAYDKKNDRYVASFYDAAPTKRTVFGTIVGKDGKVIVPPTDISQSPAQARDPSLRVLGDRVLFVYADDRDQNSGYELYAHTMSADLSTELSPPTRVTAAAGDSIAPLITFAADGTALVLFRDDRGPNPAVFETGLKCVMPP